MDVLLAIATPAGRGALGIVRFSGPGTLALAGAFLRGASRPEDLPERRATLMRAHAPHGELIDELVATAYRAPRSYTGEEMLELACHGSPYILDRLVKAGLAAGARLAGPGEFTRRAFQNGKLDLAQAEAVQALIAAETAGQHRAALRQLDGALSRRLEAARAELLDLIARVEVGLDHDEDDLDGFTGERIAAPAARLRAGFEELVASHQRGRVLAGGLRVAIVGAPNAGKSSLLNALLGRDRAIVADQPGTTRDTVEESLEIGGLRATLVDTAGLRGEAADAVEREGMTRTRQALERSDLALLVVDRSRAVTARERELHREVQASGKAITVLNKNDLSGELEIPGALCVSAKTGAGLDALRAAVAERAAPGADHADLVTSERHRDALARAAAELAAAEAAAERGPELAAQHLRDALNALGEILGKTDSEELLGAIFARFCVGK